MRYLTFALGKGRLVNSTMEILKKTSGERELHWGWLMLTVTPRFTR